MDVLKDVLAKEPVPAVQADVLQDLMPANIVEKVWAAIINEPVQEVKISIAHLKTFAYDLPFMPDRIDYKVGMCCDEIVYNRGLFTPCSKACKEGTKCRPHFNASTGFGDFKSRLAVWDNGEGIGKMQVTPDTDPSRIKSFKEVTYGEFCQKSKISEDVVNKALRDANFMLTVDPRNFVASLKTRKVRGRPAKKLVEEVTEGVSLDDESVGSVEEHSEPIEEPVEEPEETEEPKVEEEHKVEAIVEERVEEPEEVEKPKKPRAKKEKVEGEKPKPSVKKAKKEKKIEGTSLDGATLEVEQFEEE
jgi:hypothetical protein